MTEQSPLIVDIAGTTLTADDRARLQHPLTGGLILFARNWADRAQLTALTADIKAIRDDLLICVDHEGGRVQRFRPGFTELPPQRAIGHVYDLDPEAGRPRGPRSRAGAACAPRGSHAPVLRAAAGCRNCA